MSRGGGFGRGRGGGFGKGKMGGIDLPWEYDPDLKVDTKPSELFPKLEPPLAAPPRRLERAQVARYRTLRDRIHEGPLYTVLGHNVRVGKTGGRTQVDPFDGMPTYTQKYKRQRRKIPRLDTRPYVMEFFPEELRSTLDPNYRPSNGTTTSSGSATDNKKKRLLISQGNKLGVLDEFDEENEGRAGEDDDDDAEKDDDEEPAEEEQDDDFEEDEEEGDDYNAEQYFSNGEETEEGGDMGDGGDDYANDY
ncbi:hypothetical protein B0A49_01219 [Cryomyces minteri]|uniref:DNA-directed RNA polymerase III subunit n=1 Tax=Cryomyces minteri TaxID=331657 RepID=A0A4U0XNV8_9PEZI|nr:hypothetical protein B0A49_01219 [Cryomyces minteri]